MTVRPDLSVVMVNEGLSGSGSGARSLLRESADFPAQVESGAAAGLRLQNEYWPRCRGFSELGTSPV